MRKLRHYFIPHPETHRKAHLLSWHALVIYILIFILLRTAIELTSVYKPGVLGVNSNITIQQVVDGTNKERQKAGLQPVSENQNLDNAALAKAKNMFAENYWAHYSPSGKDPWEFITSSGYKFSYAGENLARNFQTSDDVVRAWMNSPSHRDNVLNSKYQDIGIAVLDGVLNGQKTTLVVQMFGKSYEAVAVKPQVDAGGQKAILPSQAASQSQPLLVAGSSIQNQVPVSKAVIDPSLILKIGGLALILLVSLLLFIDFLVLKRRGVFRISSHHLAHLSLLGVSSASLLLTKAGEVL